MITRFVFFFCGALLFAAASVALGASGTYQPTKDGKTTVWNSDPRPGESADWSGDRDSEGYAIGFGTLTWFTAKGVVYADYFGRMVRGKFDGPVNVHSHGKTGHALFVDGERSSPWATGSAPSRMAAPESVEAVGQKREARGQKSAASAKATAASEISEEAETAKKKTSKSSVLAPGAVRPIDHVGPKPESSHAKTSKRSPAIAEKPPVREKAKTETATTPVEPTPLPTIAAPETAETPVAEGPKGETENAQRSTLNPQRSTQPVTETSTSQKTEVSGQKSAASAKATAASEAREQKTGSLESLAAPPSSLRRTPAPSPSASPGG